MKKLIASIVLAVAALALVGCIKRVNGPSLSQVHLEKQARLVLIMYSGDLDQMAGKTINPKFATEEGDGDGGGEIPLIP